MSHIIENEKSRILGKLIGANMNSTADQAIPLNSTNYIIRRIVVTNASASLTLAVGGVYTGASKSGTAIVSAVQAYSGLTGATKTLDLTLAALTTILTGAQIYFALTTGLGSAATADIYVFGDDLS